jgi:hypothetical protein
MNGIAPVGGTVTITNEVIDPTPLPAALPLFGSGLQHWWVLEYCGGRGRFQPNHGAETSRECEELMQTLKGISCLIIVLIGLRQRIGRVGKLPTDMSGSLHFLRTSRCRRRRQRKSSNTLLFRPHQLWSRAREVVLRHAF